MVRLTTGERQMNALGRYVDRMLRDSHRSYLSWLDHNYPDLRELQHEVSVEFDAGRQALEAHHEQ